MVAAARWMQLQEGTSAIADSHLYNNGAAISCLRLFLMFFAYVGSSRVPVKTDAAAQHFAPDIASRAQAFLASWPLAAAGRAAPALLYAISGVSAARDSHGGPFGVTCQSKSNGCFPELPVRPG